MSTPETAPTSFQSLQALPTFTSSTLPSAATLSVRRRNNVSGSTTVPEVQQVEIAGEKARRAYFVCKRILDVLVATVLLVSLFPLIVVIAALIKLDSDGPSIFVQRRVGAKRCIEANRVVWLIHTFSFYKFRSMIRDADSSVHHAYIREFQQGSTNGNGHEKGNGNGSGTLYKLANDSRVTRIGRILRKTSLDELPQLINVLKGEMSLVGPRPALLYEAAIYTDSHYERLCVLPGITGLWQTKARCQVPFEDMVRMDIEYVRTSNLWLDLKILLLTIPAVLSCRGAS